MTVLICSPQHRELADQLRANPDLRFVFDDVEIRFSPYVKPWATVHLPFWRRVAIALRIVKRPQREPLILRIAEPEAENDRLRTVRLGSRTVRPEVTFEDDE